MAQGSKAQRDQAQVPPASGEYLFFKPRMSPFPVRSTLNARHLRTILSAIRVAWAQVTTFAYTKSAPFDPAHLHDEDELTTKLIEILNHLLQRNLITGFRSAWFQDVVRDGKQSTASTNSLDQMPDMTFRMVAHSPDEDRSESGLFVECKLVSKATGCGPYVGEGLARFVSGRYAPQMGFGLMLAYCTADFSDAAAELSAYFRLASRPESVQCNAAVGPSALVPGCHETLHVREAPCAPRFCALHLWLVRPGAR